MDKLDSNPALDPNWREMTLPNYLKALRKKIEGSWKKDPSVPASEKEKYNALCKAQEKKGSAANASDAKKFLSESVGIIVLLLRRKTAGNEAKVLSDANQVTHAIDNEESLLRIIAPDFSVNASGRWPGPVSYRSALNHLIAVSLRVHSMYPDAKFDLIVRAAARRILVPALAHNLTFLRRSSPEVFNYFLKSEKGIERFLQGHLIEKIPTAITSEEEAATAEAWRRLLNEIFDFSRKYLIERAELFTEIKRLTLEHEINPAGSSLWNELSLIASGDFSIDELLVSRVTTDLQDKLGAAPPRPIVFCARARFGLLRYSYAMIEERDLVAVKPEKALADTTEFFKGLQSVTGKGNQLDDSSCIRAFGWAYLWSRYLLLGRADDKRMNSKEFKSIQDSVGLLLDDLLWQVYNHAEKPEYQQLAIRYLAGFLTNPRFIRPKKLRENNQEKAKKYVEAMKREKLPGGLISMMEARIELHRAFNLQDKPDFSEALNRSLAIYANTLESISASEKSDNMMDGEVAAWAIPEMRYGVELLKKTITEKGNAKKSKISEFERIQKALDMIGEIQFGIYFNQEDETERLRIGLELGCAGLG